MPKRVDLTRRIFGKLEVIAKSERKDTGGKTMYICECECGSPAITVRGTNLTTGRTSTCGCEKSIGEANINKLLIENKLIFAREYTFANLSCVNELRYDFAIMNNDNQLQYLIEFDGEQHFQEGVTGSGWNTQERFEETRRNDIMKNEYCKASNIPLIRIPYTIRDNITMEDLQVETSKYLV